MWFLLRWLKFPKPRSRASDAPPAHGVRQSFSAPTLPPASLGLERIESRSHPGLYSYRNALPPPLPGYPDIRGDGLFTYEVAGVSFYQEALEKIVGGRREAPVYFRVVAVLSSEPDNPYDAHAIVIRINGSPVGHIKKADNVSLRRQLNALGITGDVQCRAEIACGWDHGRGNVGLYGLRLDIVLPPELRGAVKARKQRPTGPTRKPKRIPRAERGRVQALKSRVAAAAFLGIGAVFFGLIWMWASDPG